MNSGDDSKLIYLQYLCNGFNWTRVYHDNSFKLAEGFRLKFQIVCHENCDSFQELANQRGILWMVEIT